MWPVIVEWYGCREYWILDSRYTNLLYVIFSIFLFCHVIIECNKKLYWHGVCHFWKLYVSTLIPYVKVILDQAQHVTHSTRSGHICKYVVLGKMFKLCRPMKHASTSLGLLNFDPSYQTETLRSAKPTRCLEGQSYIELWRESMMVHYFEPHGWQSKMANFL